MVDFIGKLIGFVALWLTNWLIVMTIIQPIALRFTSSIPEENKPTPGEASSAPIYHYFKAKAFIALVISLAITIWIWHLGSNGYFGRDFWYNNWLARQVKF